MKSIFWGLKVICLLVFLHSFSPLSSAKVQLAGNAYDNKVSSEKRTVVLSKAKSFRSQVVSPNTIYEISEKIDLGDAYGLRKFTMPSGCILRFKGGMLENGYIRLENTIIDSPKQKIFDNVRIEPQQNLYLRTSWFGLSKKEDCSKVFSELLSCCLAASTLVIDTDVKIDKPISDIHITGSNIQGETVAGNRPTVYSNFSPANNKELVLLDFYGMACKFNDIDFSWEFSKKSNFTGKVSVLNLRVGGNTAGEGDFFFDGCNFVLNITGMAHTNSAVVSCEGRGYVFYNCGVNGDVGGGEFPAFDFTGHADPVFKDIARTPEHSMRRIAVIRCGAHGTRWLTRFNQDPNNENTVFFNTIISENNNDVETGLIISRAKMSGLRIENNSISPSDKGNGIIQFYSDVEGAIISGNVFNGITETTDGTVLFRTQKNNMKVRNVNITNNYSSTPSAQAMALFYADSGYSIKAEGINVIGNTLSQTWGTVSPAIGTRGFSLVMALGSGARIEDVNIIANNCLSTNKDNIHLIGIIGGSSAGCVKAAYNQTFSRKLLDGRLPDYFVGEGNIGAIKETKGPSKNRPKGINGNTGSLHPTLDIGFQYFDTDLGQPIIASKIDSKGNVTWKTAAGVVVK